MIISPVIDASIWLDEYCYYFIISLERLNNGMSWVKKVLKFGRSQLDYDIFKNFLQFWALKIWTLIIVLLNDSPRVARRLDF